MSAAGTAVSSVIWPAKSGLFASDGSEAGSGSQYSSNKDSEPPCDLLFETYELESGPHYVNVHQRQTDGSFLALDYVIVTDALPSDATATTSSEIIPPATLSSTPSSLTSQEPDHPPKNATSAIIAGTALCGLTLTILILIWWCTSMSKRKKQRQRAAAERANMEAAAEEGGHPHQKQDLPMKQSNGLGYTALVDRRKEDSLPIRTVRKARSGFVEYLNFKVSSIPMPHMPYFASSTSSSSEEWVDIEGKASGWAKSIPMPSAPQAMSHVTMPSAGDLRRSEPETTSVEAPVEGEHQTLLPKRRVTFV